MIKIVDDIRDVDIYLNLRDKVDWIKLTRPQAQRALDNSVKVFTVLDDDKPIGMGRVVGDEAVISCRLILLEQEICLRNIILMYSFQEVIMNMIRDGLLRKNSWRRMALLWYSSHIRRVQALLS